MPIDRRNLLAGMSLVLLPTTVRATPLVAEVPRLLQGPMLGFVSPTEMIVWARASGPHTVVVEYADNRAMTGAVRSMPEQATAAQDYTVRCRVTGLKPGTRYYYRMLVDGQAPEYQDDQLPYGMRTAPGAAQPFRLAYGSCLRVELDPQQRIWNAVRDLDPDVFFWIGDNIYGDALRPNTLAEEYRKQADVPALQPVFRSVPNLSIWDDHDYGLNDSDRTSAVREGALVAFKNYWANPAYGLDDTPGIFFKYSYAGVDFFMLDDRYYRDPNILPDTPEKTQLGKVQLAWLKRELLASKAVFKMLVAGGGWTKAKGPGGDSWASFLHERDGLFEFIRKNAITGVVCMSGDSHVAELNAVPWSELGGYDFYDLVSSPMAQDCDYDWVYRRPERRIRKPYEGGPNFGVIDFDPVGERPSITFRTMDDRGHSVWPVFTLYADELVNGQSSWASKMDANAREWHARNGYMTLKPIHPAGASA